jgi:hypothetical protein
MLFLQAEFADEATSAEGISALWDRDGAATNAEWKFWQTFAATCLSHSYISTMVQERSIGKLAICDGEGLSVIESLLIERDRS